MAAPVFGTSGTDGIHRRQLLEMGGIAPLQNGALGTTTAVAGAATLNKMAGIVTSESSITTAAGSDYTLTLTNSTIAVGDFVLASCSNGTNTTEGIAVNRTQVSAGQVIIHVRNTNASTALNGSIVINFLVCKQQAIQL
jgi:hypothetical protein